MTSSCAPWATAFLDGVSGVTVVLKDRVKKHPPVCQACHRPIRTSCHCGIPLSLTEEKGVDVVIATDMIKLAWEDAYDWAVLVSTDGGYFSPSTFTAAPSLLLAMTASTVRAIRCASSKFANEGQ